MGYCPFPSLGHDTMDCIVTRQGTGRHGQARHDQQHVTTRPGGLVTLPTCTRGKRQRASAWPGSWGWVAIQILYRGGGEALCHDTVRDTATIRRPAPCDMAQESCNTLDNARGRGLGLETIFVCRSAHAGWAQCMRSLGHGCVHCALNPVLTQCTLLSHCLDHCSWTLFTGF